MGTALVCRASQELIDTVDEAAKDHHDKGFFQKLFFGTAAIVGALLLCIIGSTAAIAFLTSPITSEKGEDGQTVSFMAANDGTGTITQTLPASATLPLLAAPVLPKAMLRSVRQITVTLADPELGMKVEGTYVIDQLMWYNKTAVAFHTNSGGQIRIWNGEAHFFDKDGMKYSLCVSDVSCAAFKVDDATGQTKNAIMEEANTALEEAGFGDSNGARTLRRRRLQVPPHPVSLNPAGHSDPTPHPCERRLAQEERGSWPRSAAWWTTSSPSSRLARPRRPRPFRRPHHCPHGDQTTTFFTSGRPPLRRRHRRHRRRRARSRRPPHRHRRCCSLSRGVAPAAEGSPSTIGKTARSTWSPTSLPSPPSSTTAP